MPAMGTSRRCGRTSRSTRQCRQSHYPTTGPRVGKLNGLFAKTRKRAIFLGAFTWGGKHGTVVLAPDNPRGGEQGGHPIFRWRDAGVDYAVGLHAWDPLAQAFATLRKMIGSI
jgi:hypothetical protein